jgi:hypothetical protein
VTFSSQRDLRWWRAGLAVLAACGVLFVPQAAFAADGGPAGHRSAIHDRGRRTHAARQPSQSGQAGQSAAPLRVLKGAGTGGRAVDSAKAAVPVAGAAGGPVMVTCASSQAESPAVTISAAWADSSILDHHATSLQITLHKVFTCNSVVGLGFQVSLPATLYITTGTPTSTCPGTLTAGTGTSVINLSNTTLGSAAGNCVVEVPVTGHSSGTYTLTAANFTNLTGIGNAVTDQPLTVTAGPLAMYGDFSDSPIDALGTSDLDLVLYRTDQNTTLAVTGVGFRLTLPPGLTVASGTQTNTCGGSLTATHGTTVAVVAGAGLSVGASTCTLSFKVTSGVAGSYGLQAATVTNVAGVSSSLGNYCLGSVSTARIETGCAPALQVDPLAQTITFAQPADASVAKHTAVLTATATSGLTVTFTSATTGTCSVAVATVQLLNPGTCTLDAHQAGNGTYAAASVASRSFVIGAPTEPPASVTAMAGVSSIVAHWSAPLNLTGVTGYTAIARPGPATCSTDGALSCVMGGTAGVTYTITVIARNSLGDSLAAGPSNDVTPTRPPISNTIPTTHLDLTTDQGLITTAAPSQDIVVIGTGFAAYSTATIVIYSAPVVLGTVITDAHGNFRKPVTIPAHLAAGRHTMIAAGVGPNGAAHYLRLHVRVRAASTGGLARTGAPIIALALLGTASMFGGSGMIVASRPRRRRLT